MRRWLELLLMLLLAGTLAGSTRYVPTLPLRNLSAQTLEDYDMAKTAFVGRPTGDWIARFMGDQTTGDKTVCDIGLSPGGSLIHAGGAYQRVTGRDPLIGAILARDVEGKLLAVEIARRFPGWQMIPTAKATRVSLCVPKESGEGYRIFTTLPPLDIDATKKRFASVLAEPDLRQVVVGSLAAEDDEVFQFVLQESRGRGIRTYWIPNGSQLRDRQRALDSLSLVDVLQLNSRELASLADCKGIVPGINRLRECGARGSIVCTNGSRGIVTYHDGDCYVQPAFDVDGEGNCLDVALGDTVGGTLAAWMEEHADRDFCDGIRYAAVAAAMRLSNEPQKGGWRALEAWARSHKVMRPQEVGRKTKTRSYIAPAAVTLMVGVAITVVFIVSSVA